MNDSLSSPQPADVASWQQRAWEAIQSGDIEQAMSCFREVVRLDSGIVEAWANLAALSLRRGETTAAAEYYREAVNREPTNVALQKALIRALREADQRDAAIEQCRAVLSQHPQDAQLHQLLGNLLQEIDEYDSAVASLDRAIQLAGPTPVLLSNLGIARFRRGEIEEAISCFRQAVQLQPEYADAHFHLGMALLLQGDFDQGWHEYDWRTGGANHPQSRRSLPRWTGQPLAGKTLLLAAEQGLGDTIQFIRFAPTIKQRYSCQVILYCQASLRPLLSSCHGIDAIVTRDGPLPSADYFIPLLSIPSVLQFHPQRELAAAYLHAEPTRTLAWREKLNQVDDRTVARAQPRLRVGIAWQGDPKFPADRCRSIPLAQFQPLAQIPSVQLFSLQKGHGTEQLADFRRSSKIHDFGDDLDASGGAFLDTAAILQSLDVVVTSDSAIAHLAGALGAPVWIALGHVPDWRWQLERSDCPWYPSARLFRQPRLGDWASVFTSIAAHLQQAGETSLVPTRGNFA